MSEWGLFSDEGLVEGDFYTEEEAQEALSTYALEDGLEVHEICSEHPDYPRHYCELCDAEEEDDSDLDELERKEDENERF